MEQLEIDYDKAFELAVDSLHRLPDEIRFGEISSQQKNEVMHFIYHQRASKDLRVKAYEQVAAITEDPFFLKAARRTEIGFYRGLGNITLGQGR